MPKNELRTFTYPRRVWEFLITLSLTLFGIAAFGQKEANNWYFGSYAGITFNTSKPSALTNGKLTTSEGCATISNADGQLLFYTDGIKVWDSTHQVTPNGSGLKGNSTSTQSAVVVPRPGNAKQYYIFTVDWEARSNGLQYSLFDMSLNSGNGDIVSTTKNIKLTDPTCEKITAVQHANGTDFWVCTHKFNSDQILAYAVTNAGVDANPVISYSGSKINGISANTLGYMKVSPDGSKIAYANWKFDTCYFADFNVSTGKVTNIWSFYGDDFYGIEFSATSKYFYAAEMYKWNIYQFDAKAKTKSDFLASKVSIDKKSSSTDIGALQIGPDKKIYIARSNSKYLDVIHAPDSAGTNCRLRYNYVDLLSGNSTRYGLPTFIQSYFNPDFTVKNTCFGDTVWFSITNSSIVDSVKWNFGDIASGKKNTVTGFKVFHLFSDTGKYRVKSIAYKNGLRDTSYFDVEQKIYASTFTLGRDTFVCDKKTLKLGYRGEWYKDYSWSDFSKDTFLIVKTAGTYSLTIKDKYGCKKSDTVKVTVLQAPTVDLGKDSSICDSTKTIVLDSKNSAPLTKYLWSSSHTTKTDIVKVPGKYWVVATNPCGTARDTVQFKYLPKPTVDLPKDSTLCYNISVTLDATYNDPQVKYLWSTGDQTPAITVNKTGNYRVTLSNICGSNSDSTILTFYKMPNPNIGPDQIFCDKMSSITKTASVANAQDTYLWSTGSTGVSETFTVPGKYWLTVTSPCGIESDTVRFKIAPSPVVNIGKDSALCGHFSYMLDAGNPGMYYSWLPTGETTQTIFANKQTIYKVMVTTLDGCTASDEMEIKGNCITKFWFPNAFTPTNDLLNESFKPSLTNVENYEMRIFNRWGEILFKTKDITIGWDGNYQGKPCQAGVYFYVAEFISTEDNTLKIVKGDITLLR